MKAIDMAREMVEAIKVMDQNGMSFYNDTLIMLRDVHGRIMNEVLNPPQDQDGQYAEEDSL